MGLYQDLEASSGSRKGAVDNVYRRLSPDGGIQRESQGSGIRSGISIAMLRLHDKYRENNHGANSITRIPRLYDKYEDDGVKPPTRKIWAESRKLLEAGQVSARALSRLIGKMNATNQVIPPPPL